MSFALHHPTSVAAATQLARQLGQDVRFLAGGTDLLIQIHRRQQTPRHLIALDRLGLAAIVEHAEEWSIGALATHKSIESHPAFQVGALIALSEAARVVGGHQVRNIGTIGGNVANASPAADLLPPLLVLDATLDLAGPDGMRAVALPEFLHGQRQTDRAFDEIVTTIRFAKPSPRSATAFLKSGRRKAMEIALVSVAARLTLNAAGRCQDVRIALGAVAPLAMRAAAAEQLMEAGRPDDDRLRAAGHSAAVLATPISDVRASAEYRRRLVETLVPRTLRLCLDRIAQEAAPSSTSN